ncbi:ABC transporter ATP-binding protein [Candidatus Microgenomates bacterium]|nr:MAG: ABC transporter ATP-binding protein [Candidatus Microgenomates bacterium]
MDKISSVIRVARFSWTYSVKIAGKKIWLLLFYLTYKNIHPIINAYFIKLAIDTLTQVGQAEPSLIIRNIAFILIAHFLVDSWDNFSFRHSLVLSRTLQRKLLSGIDVDLAYKNASLPITTIENSKFKDKYTLVKREAGFRLYPLVDQSVNIVAGLITFIATAVLLVGFNPLYLPILLILQVPRLFLIKPALNKVTHRASLSAKLSRHWDIYLDFLEGIKGSYEARILKIKEVVNKRLLNIQEQTVGLFEKTESELLFPRVATAIVPMMGVFTIAFMAAKDVVSKATSIGDWQLIVNTAHRLGELSKRIIDDIGSLSEASIFVDKLVEVLEMEEETSFGNEIEIGNVKSLEFDNVSFKYPNTKQFALRNVSFVVNEAENVAIVGHNGAGKTTLVKLLCRFYEPSEGVIKLNGIDIRDYDLSTYWGILSALFQDFETYGVSAKESIGFGDIKNLSNQTRIEKVAKLTGIHKYLSSLPKGYETPLIRDLENGVGLSTGQWQKVAISRALFRKSKIIILDEPTSNIDPESEEDIFNKLIRTVNKRMMFLISHRFSTVKRANRIIVIDSGKLTEQGSHKELMAQNGLYAKLFRIQSESYKE